MGGLKDNLFQKESGWVDGCPSLHAIPEPLPAFTLTWDQVRQVPLFKAIK